MPNGKFMKHLFLPVLGFGVMAAATAASAQTAPQAIVSAIGDNTNVVFVENHIVIDGLRMRYLILSQHLRTLIYGLLHRTT